MAAVQKVKWSLVISEYGLPDPFAFLLTKRLFMLVHRRGDGLSSPSGGRPGCLRLDGAEVGCYALHTRGRNINPTYSHLAKSTYLFSLITFFQSSSIQYIKVQRDSPSPECEVSPTCINQRKAD